MPWLRSLALECGFDSHALSRRLGVSLRQLSRHFKVALCSSPQRWLNEQRLLVAKQMLASAASVKEVAYMLGFTQVSQFCRDYRARFGHSPSVDLKGARSGRRGPCAAFGMDRSCYAGRPKARCIRNTRSEDAS